MPWGGGTNAMPTGELWPRCVVRGQRVGTAGFSLAALFSSVCQTWRFLICFSLAKTISWSHTKIPSNFCKPRDFNFLRIILRDDKWFAFTDVLPVPKATSLWTKITGNISSHRLSNFHPMPAIFFHTRSEIRTQSLAKLCD